MLIVKFFRCALRFKYDSRLELYPAIGIALIGGALTSPPTSDSDWRLDRGSILPIGVSLGGAGCKHGGQNADRYQFSSGIRSRPSNINTSCAARRGEDSSGPRRGIESVYPCWASTTPSSSAEGPDDETVAAGACHRFIDGAIGRKPSRRSTRTKYWKIHRRFALIKGAREVSATAPCASLFRDPTLFCCRLNTVPRYASVDAASSGAGDLDVERAASGRAWARLSAGQTRLSELVTTWWSVFQTWATMVSSWIVVGQRDRGLPGLVMLYLVPVVIAVRQDRAADAWSGHDRIGEGVVVGSTSRR